MRTFKKQVQRWSVMTFLVLTGASVWAESQFIEKNYDVQPGGQLTLRSDRGDIDIVTWNKNQVGIEITKESRRQDALEAFVITLEHNGDDVYIAGEAPRNSRVDVRYRITVPTEYAVRLETGGGNINVASLQGAVFADTSGGSIHVGDVREGSVDVNTSGGSIRIGDVQADVKADTSGGNITIGDVGGDLSADTSGGNIDIGVVLGKADIETSGGRIRVSQGGTETNVNTSGGGIDIGPAQGDVRAETSGGNIKIDVAQGSVYADTSGGSVRVAGSGGNVEVESSGGNLFVGGSRGYVKADTSGGNINIENARGFIEAETSGGRIEAEMIEALADAHVKLSSSGGDLRLVIPAELAATIDAQIRITRSAVRDYRIYSDFPLTIKGENSDKVRGEGVVNGGGNRVTLTTTNGDIYIEMLAE